MPQTSTHSHSDGGVIYLRCVPVHQEQLGVQCLFQGHFDTLGEEESGSDYQPSDC